MEVINNKKEWKKFSESKIREPKQYPVIAWYEYREYGIMGDGREAKFALVPPKLSKEEAAVWIKGFEAAYLHFN